MAHFPDTGIKPIIGKKYRLLPKQREIFDRIFICPKRGKGYVLDFSRKEMTMWFNEYCDIDIFQERFQTEGGSMGNTLRGFFEDEEPHLVAQSFRNLWDYRCSLKDYVEEDNNNEAFLKDWFEQFMTALEKTSSWDLDALKKFPEDTTLSKLRASIKADLRDEKPEVALDRVHTYCVTRFCTLLKSHNQLFDEKRTLQGIFGCYRKVLNDENAVKPPVLSAFRAQHKLFEGLNEARNKHSLTHPSSLLDTSEAKFIVECVLATLSFIERLEEKRQASIANQDG